MKQIVCNGSVFLSKNTKRFLFLFRANGKTANTWGLVGGKRELSDNNHLDTLKREMNEELGRIPTILKIVPLDLFTSKNFQFHYNTYLTLVEHEFIPELNSEHYGYAWCSYNSWPQPLHNGVKTTLSNKIIKIKLEMILDMLD